MISPENKYIGNNRIYYILPKIINICLVGDVFSVLIL